MTGENYVNAWILRLAASVLANEPGDHLETMKTLESIAVGLETRGIPPVEDPPMEEPPVPDDDYLPDTTGEDPYDSVSITDVEKAIISRNWPDTDENYVRSLVTFHDRGLSFDDMVSWTSTSPSWRYFCGIAWRTIKAR